MGARKEFDKLVHHRDPKTGRVIKSNPYQLKIDRSGKRFIRDGITYYENGDRVHPSEVSLSEQRANEDKAKLDANRAEREEIEKKRKELEDYEKKLNEARNEFKSEVENFKNAQQPKRAQK
jgi:phage-related minor tail protein